MLTKKCRFRSHLTAGRRQGFTLVEMLLVLVILATLAAIVLPQLAGKGEKAKINATKTQVSTFSSALDMFETELGFYPKTADGLDALIVVPANPPKGWDGPYLKSDSIPTDPWGNAYRYECPGRHNTRGYDITSAGPDMTFDTQDDIANYSVGGTK